MRRAIRLAEKGIGFVNPNPLVGAVIVKDGRVIGEGCHEKYGEKHAERNALAACAEDPKGAEMYVTLEPCCHYGKNPPCTDAVIEAGIRRVYVGSSDPNPLVAGKGVEILRSRGIEVIDGYMREECDKLNDIFFHYITTKTPYVILKAAVSADGRIAANADKHEWITNEKSRANVHMTRKRVSAILSGIGTVLSDDPMLNCRCENPSNPIRIICDSRLRLPVDSRIAESADKIPTYAVTLCDYRQKTAELEAKGVRILHAEADKDGRVDLIWLMKALGEMGIDSVLIEGGAKMYASALKSGIVQRVQMYVAPLIIGGDGKEAVAPLGIGSVCGAVRLKALGTQKFDGDILLEYEVE